MIPGFIISFLTFPGIILHEFAHKKFCDLFGVKVLEVNYFTSDGGGYVIHEKPKTYASIFWISVGPLVINTTACFLFGLILATLSDDVSFVYYLVGWLAISFGMHSFPSNHDVKHILNASKKELQTSGNLLHYLSYPFVGLIYVANLLRFIWIDLLWAIFIVSIALGLFSLNVDQNTNSNTLLNRVGDYYCSTFHYKEAEKLDPGDEEMLRVQGMENMLKLKGESLKGLKSDLEYMYVDEYSQSSIDFYNSKIETYNSEYDQYDKDFSIYNYKLDSYNERSEKYNNYLIQNCKK